MTSEAIQRMVARLHQEPAFRQLFVANPEAVLNDYQVSAAERRALLRMHGRLARVAPDGQFAQPPDGWWP